MSLFDHKRLKIVSEVQHLYRHALFELDYYHPALPDTVTDAEQAMDYILNVLYPRVKESVATPADLPTGVDTPNLGDVAPTEYDQRIVQDDGDGNAAMYMFFKKDGQVAPQWNKIADMDFGANSVVQGLLDQTQYLFIRKFGSTDYDQDTELPLTGKDAGQHLYGGDSANQNLTLHATNGDDPGVHTGFVQVDDNFRPYSDLEFNLGTATERWLNLYAGTAIIGTGTMTITSDGLSGSITDTSGLISFGDENLLTTGNVDATIITASNSLVVDDSIDSLTIGTSSILSDTGAISFGTNNLSTTGTLAAGVTTIDGDIQISGNQIVSTLTGVVSFDNETIRTTGIIQGNDLWLSHNGLTGSEIRLKNSLNQTTLLINDALDHANFIALAGQRFYFNSDTGYFFNGGGNVYVEGVGAGIVNTQGFITIGNGWGLFGRIRLETDKIYNTVNNFIDIGDNLTPEITGLDLGSLTKLWDKLFVATEINDGTEAITTSELMAMSRNIYRDVAKTQPAQDGDALFYNAASGKWLASIPDAEIDHSALSNLTVGDAGHTQFAMLAGRATGQTIWGGTGLGEELRLGGQSSGTNTVSIAEFKLYPTNSDGTFSLGDPTHSFNNLYMSGEAIGLRFENGIPTFDAGDVGRAAFNTTDNFLYINDGSAFKKVGHNTYNALHTNVQLGLPIDVSGSVTDARNCIWQLCDVSSNEEIMAVPIQKTATTVTVNNTVALPAGNYRLIGIQV